MWIESVKTFNFRNLLNETVKLEAGVNFLIGKNGHGKTNLIEAIGLLSHGKSLRGAKSEDLFRHGESSFSVFGKVIPDQEDSRIELGVSQELKTKSLFINGARTNQIGRFIGNLICITFFPSDLEIVKGAPAERRRLLDKHIVDIQPTFIQVLQEFNRVLKSKGAVLRSNQADDAALESLDIMLAKLSCRIVIERQKIIEKIQPKVTKVFKALVTEANEDLELKLESSIRDEAKEISEDAFLNVFRAHRKREVARQSSSIGPHRDDLAITIKGVDARKFASQGQARSIVIALKLAMLELIQDELNKSPIVLLDDIDSELDEDRRAALFEAVQLSNRQVIITGTEIRKEVAAGYNKIEIKNGAFECLSL